MARLISGPPRSARSPARRDRARATTAAWACSLLLVASTGCHPADPCPHTDACPEGTVCQPDGACRPLEDGDTLRFTATRRLAATGWAHSHDDGSHAPPAAGDALVIGGDHQAVAHLSFGPLPEGVELVRALLVLRPHPAWHGVARPWRVSVHEGPAPTKVERGRVTRRYRPPRAVARLRTGIGRPVVLEVTSLVDAALDGPGRSVSITLRMPDRHAPAVRLASPRAAEATLRPRLVLVVR